MSETYPSSGNVVPSSIAQVGIITKYTFLDYFRSRRFLVLAIITLLIGFLLTFAVGYYNPPGFRGGTSLNFYGNWWGSVTTFVVILSGIFFGGDAISGEFQNKTGYFGIPNPINRSSIYVGKWLAAFLASTIILGVFTVITLGNGIAYFGLDIPIEFWESVLFTWLYLVSVLGFTFFFSAVFKSSSIAILTTVILFLFVFGIIELVAGALAHVEPWFILTYGAAIISNVFLVPYPPHITVLEAGPLNLTTYTATIPQGIAIMAVYFIITFILGLLLFQRKEFT
ncbi:MAG: ABC transporter permease [Candidatus Bathyarchaeota archaeon]|nr:ABC transporter permease [Candidatus Bathyarchaeota archaeon]